MNVPDVNLKLPAVNEKTAFFAGLFTGLCISGYFQLGQLIPGDWALFALFIIVGISAVVFVRGDALPPKGSSREFVQIQFAIARRTLYWLLGAAGMCGVFFLGRLFILESMS